MPFLPDNADQLTVIYGSEDITISRSILLLCMTVSSSFLAALTISPRSLAYTNPSLLTNKWSYVLILELLFSGLYTFASIGSVVELSLVTNDPNTGTPSSSLTLGSTNSSSTTTRSSSTFRRSDSSLLFPLVSSTGILYGYTIFHTVMTGILWLSILTKGGLIPQRTPLSLGSSILGILFGTGLLHSSILRLLPINRSCTDITVTICDVLMGSSFILLCSFHALGISGLRNRNENDDNDEESISSSSSSSTDHHRVLSSSTTSTTTIDNVPKAPVSEHDKGSFPEKIFFSFLDTMFTVGYRRQLNMEDIEALPSNDNTEKWARTFQEELRIWRNYSSSSTPSSSSSSSSSSYNSSLPILFTLLLRVFGVSWMYLAFLQAGCVTMAMISPILLNQLLGFIEASSSSSLSDPWLGLLWALLLSFTQIGAALFTTQFSYWYTRLQIQVRAALVSSIYTSGIQAPLSVRTGTTSGKITNFLSVDIQKIQDVVPSFHQFWSLPIQVGVTLYLLYTQVAGAFTAGLIVLAIFIPLNMMVSKRIGTLTGIMMKCRDERVRITGELLNGIRIIKMQAWEIPLRDRIRVARNLELRALRSRKYLDAVCVFLWASTPVLIALATFTAVVLFTSSSTSLSASTVFTTISLLNLLIFPMNAFPWVLTGVFEAWVSLKRLQSFLCYSPPRTDDASSVSDTFAYDAPEYRILDATAENGHAPLCSIRGTYAFPVNVSNPAMDNADDTVIRNETQFLLNLTVSTPSSSTTTTTTFDSAIQIFPNEFVAVCGPVGSGKSAFFAALLRDMVAVQNNGLNNPSLSSSSSSSSSSFISPVVTLSTDCTFAYAPQIPWIRGASFRDNIVMGSIWDAERYQRVLLACCLQPDLATLAEGDRTIINSTTLSGGQKQRINLARSLYARSKIVLLDDPLSALDTRVANVIWARALAPYRTNVDNGNPAVPTSWTLFDDQQCSFIAADQRTMVMVTYDRKLLEASKVLVLRKGNIVYWGSPQFMTEEAKEVSDMKQNRNNINNFLVTMPTNASTGSVTVSSVDISDTPPKPSPKDKAIEDDEREREEAREKGIVKQRVIRTYIEAIGKGLSIVVIGSLFLMQLTRNGSDWWLSVWSAAVTDPEDATGASAPLIRLLAIWNNRQFLLVYGIIASGNILSTIVRSWSFAEAGIRAAINLHDRLLLAILYAPMNFHDKTPAGRLLNRFSADQYAVDESLPFQLNIFLAQTYGMAGTILVLAYSTSGIFLLALPPLAYVYYYLQKRYRSTSRELKRLDSVTRSPLFSQFGDTLEGSAVIRALSVNRRMQNVPLTLRESIDPNYRLSLVPLRYANVYCSFQYEYQQTLELLDANQRTSFTSSMASQWLALRLQGIGTLIIAVVALVAAFTRIFTDTARAAQGDDAGCVPEVVGIMSSSGILEDNSNDDGGDAGAAGIAGLSLSYAIPIVGGLQSLIAAFAETEKEMVSVERIREYVDVLPEESVLHTDDVDTTEENTFRGNDDGERTGLVNLRNKSSKGMSTLDDTYTVPLLENTNDTRVPVSSLSSSAASSLQLWYPSQGHIEFRHLTVQYSGTLRPALDDLSITIPALTKVGICGRTGSGKTTIISALWRLIRWQNGSILIDNQDLRSIPLPTLRSSIAIVPQEPLLFSGTIKYNLDPSGIYTDNQLLSVLNACQLLPDTVDCSVSSSSSSSSSLLGTVNNRSYLERYIEENGSNWSVGERQLLCLARALLRKTRIIAVDEATSAADARTEALISRVLTTVFHDSTILLIAHRMSTLLQCDLIMVMDNGKCVEVGKPQELLNRGPNAIFTQLLEANNGK